MKKFIFNLILLVFFTLTSLSANATDNTLIFSAIPDQDSSQLKQRFSKIATYLSSELNIPVKYIPVNSYAAAITAFRNDQVQLAWFGGLSGVRARLLVQDSEAIAQGIEDTEFKTYIIAHHSTGLKLSDKLPEEIAGKNFTFGSKGSTSGRLMPEYYLRNNFNKSPSELFNKVGFSGNHSRTISLVQSGAYQIGAVNFKVWEKQIKDGKIDLNKVSVIWETPTYPDYQWSIRGDIEKKFGKGFKQKVQRALLNMQDPELLSAFPRSGFIKAENDDYLPILETAKKIGIMD